VRVNVNERDEITASVAAHAELGPRYDAAVAEGLVERIGDEIDKRIDARLGTPAGPGRQAQQQHNGQPPAYQGPVAPAPARPAAVPPPAAYAPSRGSGLSGVILGLGSMGLGVGATSVVVAHHPGGVPDVLMVLLIWVMIAVINIAHSQWR
jgi:hypothetical protein